MTKSKKRNCKHGLSNLQEIRARKIRQDIVNNGSSSVYCLQLREMYAEYSHATAPGYALATFSDHVKEVDVALWSAFQRLKRSILEEVIQ